MRQILTAAALVVATSPLLAAEPQPPQGFTALFNGKDLGGWQAAIQVNKRQKMSPDELAAAQKKADDAVLPVRLTVKTAGSDICSIPNQGGTSGISVASASVATTVTTGGGGTSIT